MKHLLIILSTLVLTSCSMFYYDYGITEEEHAEIFKDDIITETPVIDNTKIQDLEIPGFVIFKSGSSEVEAIFRKKLDNVSVLINSNPKMTVTLLGHADYRGHNEENYELSMARNNAVKDHLVLRGVKEDRIFTIPYGEVRPAELSQDEFGNFINRRVDLILNKMETGSVTPFQLAPAENIKEII